MLTRSCTGAALLALFVVPFASGCAPRTVIQVPASAAAVRGITVTGVGEAKAPPDIARTNIGVEVRAESVDQATALSNQRMGSILQALKQLGIADKDLRTHSFSIAFEQAPVPPVPWPQPDAAPQAPREKAAPAAPAPEQAEVRGVYRASNMLEVTIRDLTKAGAVLQAATQAGANNVWGISFELEDPKALLAQARIKAVEHAKQNAEALAKLSGVALGPIVSVSEGGGPGVMPPVYAMKSMDSGGGDVPVEHGEVTVSQQVQIVYALPE